MKNNNEFKKIPVGKFGAPQKCYICKGVGLEVCGRCCGNGTFNGRTCPDCDGKGTVKCAACRGRGLVDE